METQLNGNRELANWSTQVNQRSNELIDLSRRIRERMSSQSQALRELKNLTPKALQQTTRLLD